MARHGIMVSITSGVSIEELEEWCMANVGAYMMRWDRSYATQNTKLAFFFVDQADLVMFKLAWAELC